MAEIIPSLDKIYKLKVKPQEGELKLLIFLAENLDNTFEVYFNPYMNGDRPDIVLMHKDFGVMIIEVKDYNLDCYQLDEHKHWSVKNDKSFHLISPVTQAIKYKENLYNLHIEKLFEKKIKNFRYLNIVSCAIYFHNASCTQINDFLVTPFSKDINYQKFLKNNIDFIGNDNLNQFDINKLLRKRQLISSSKSFLFTDDLYLSFMRYLKPPVHIIEDGKEYFYSSKQKEIIFETQKKQQRIKGVVGSGKTTVLAARAVQAYKRTKGKVLILTFNITLKNYIHDKISEVREEFPWSAFVISNYHLFINSELNNLGIPIIVPNYLSKDEINKYLEQHYYSNKALFVENKERIKPYDIILIDEIQDYKRLWMEIIKECFLAPEGEYVLFGDVKQNIYNNQISNQDVSTNVLGVTELKYCYRSDFKVKDLAIQYQKEIFKDKYELDSFNSDKLNELQYERNQQGSINYMYLSNTDNISALYTIIYENAINKDIPPNDITILANSVDLLRQFDVFYRYSSNEKTNTMFETSEIIYHLGLNFLKKDKEQWYKDGINLLRHKKDKDEKFAQDRLCILFTLYDLYLKYNERFIKKLSIFCENYFISLDIFLDFRTKYNTEIEEFKEKFNSKNLSGQLEMIRKNKKIHFFMNSGTIKLSTIHSFKGWESDMVFLIIEKKHSKMETSFDEILYTGITRSRSNLIIINFGNEEYRDRLKYLVDEVK
ncbi:MAG: NERD domain-containing protein [Paludibacter sp.]|nr:NERD domain-containing protein [Paludibacter sp.]